MKKTFRMVLLAACCACCMALGGVAYAGEHVSAPGDDSLLAASGSYRVEGLELSAESIELGESVTLTPRVTGDASGLTFNYAWAQGSGWAYWDSTLKRTGQATADSSWVFTPDRPGTYRVWFDAIAPDGSYQTYERTVEVVQEWSVERVSVSPASGLLGTDVQLSVEFAPGSNTAGLTYNFAWRKLPGWATWGSDLKSGSARTQASASLALPGCGAYELWVDVIDANGAKSTYEASGDYQVELPYQVTGLDVSETSIVLGESVTMAPQVSGDTSILTINYAWALGDGWDYWDSTVKRTGERTSDLSWEFTPTREGTYRVWVDCVASDGTTLQFYRTVKVGRGWDFEGITVLTESPIERGNPVTYAVQVTGTRASQLEYNFAWKRGNSWEYWDSTVKETGAMTTDTQATFTPKWGGNYTLWVDVHDPLSDVTETYYMDGTLKVTRPWDFANGGLSVSKSLVKLGGSIDLKAQTIGQTADLQYQFVCKTKDSSKLTVIQDYSTATTCTWTPASAGDYTVYVYVRDSSEEIDFASSDVSVWNFSSVSLSAYDNGGDDSLGKTVTLKPQLGCSNTSGFTFTYRWKYGSESGTIASNTSASSVSWAPTEGYGTYTFTVVVKAPDGSTVQASVSRWLQRDDPYKGKYQYISSSTDYLILVDSSTCKFTVYRGSQYDWIPIRYWDCSPGAVATPTTNGLYTVGSRGYSFGSGFTCYYWTQMHGDYLIHSGEYYQGTFVEMDNRMGVRISHGCVRLYLERAKWVYDTIPSGTSVYCFGAY